MQFTIHKMLSFNLSIPPPHTQNNPVIGDDNVKTPDLLPITVVIRLRGSNYLFKSYNKINNISSVTVPIITHIIII